MNCIFCKIVQRKDPQSKRIIFENAKYIALLVSHPVTRGHCIVLPKEHEEELKDMPHKGELLEAASAWAEQLIVTLSSEAYVLKLNNNLSRLEEDALHVRHLHMHIVPRYSLKDDTVGRPNSADDNYFEEILAILGKR